MDLAQRPGDHECFDFHRNYVAQVPEGNILETLEQQLTSVPAFISAVPSAEWDKVHPPYGWTIGQVIEHCCDAERVFGYRVLRFATGDKTDLPGWDENFYADSGYAVSRDQSLLKQEFESLRQSNLCLLQRIRKESLDYLGTADGRQVSVRTVAWLMAGHWLHHEGILKKRLGH